MTMTMRLKNAPKRPPQDAWHPDRRVWAGFVALLTGLAALAGCADGEPRRAPFPTFDARAPFVELVPGAASATSDPAQKSGASEFEKAIAESMRQTDSTPPDQADDGAVAPIAVQTQKVELPGGLMSIVPLDFDEWQWESKDGTTIITHRLPGQTQPDAVIYAERFSELIRTYPSREMQRFIVSVDPILLPMLAIPEMPEGVVQGAADSIAETKPSITLNYRSSRDSFTGWQWFGHNPARVEIRLGRTLGQWRGFDPRTTTDGNPPPPSSAWMLLGSARVDGDLGTHLAVICKTAPRCAVAAELSEFLDRISPADSSYHPTSAELQ